jgi:UDP-N-acetyl-D-galactosamine dehydrogenase
MIAAGGAVKGAKANILGLAFKENCADVRNSKVADLAQELESFGVEVSIHDPQVDGADAREHFGIELKRWADLPVCDALIVAVAHREFVSMPLERLTEHLRRGGCFIDVKAAYDPKRIEQAGFRVWRL